MAHLANSNHRGAVSQICLEIATPPAAVYALAGYHPNPIQCPVGTMLKTKWVLIVSVAGAPSIKTQVLPAR